MAKRLSALSGSAGVTGEKSVRKTAGRLPVGTISGYLKVT